MTEVPDSCVYGAPPPALAETPASAVQVSPLAPGAADLADAPSASLSSVLVAAPAGTLERRYVLAQALRCLRPGGRLTALARKDRGGARLSRELAAFGFVGEEVGRRHYRICSGVRGETLEGIEEAIAAGGPRRQVDTGLWSQPGVFSWDRTDPGSALLVNTLTPLSGRGADLGCGVGVLALEALKSPKVERLDLFDVDRRAVAAARRNIQDPRAHVHWADVLSAPGLEGLDFIVCNPPFHEGGAEDHGLGQAFIRAAAAALKRGGVFVMVANRHLPYEAMLAASFSAVARRADAGGYKVYEARK